MARESRYDARPELTPREREVLELLRLGLTDAEIGERLGISRPGVSYHVGEIIGKLGVRNRYEAAAWPDPPPWWAGVLAPLAFLWRRGSAALPVKASSLAATVSGGLVLALVAGLALIAVLLARGGTGSSDELVEGPGGRGGSALSSPAALSPPARPASTPTATPDPLPQVDVVSGIPLYVKGGSLWLGLQASPPRPVVGSENGAFAGYAGAVRVSDSNYDVYYIQQTSVQRDPNGGSGGTAQLIVYREGLDGSGFQEVLRFTGRANDFPWAESDANVSPDGHYLALADLEGLAIIDLQSGDVTRLLDNNTDGPEPMAFFSYGRPIWSSDGQRFVVSRYQYEEAWDVLVEPFQSPPAFRELGQAYGANWSSSGDRLCLWQSIGIDSPRAAVYDTLTAATDELLPRLDPRRPEEAGGDIRGCAWAGDGRLAFAFGPNGVEAPVSIAMITDGESAMGNETLDSRGQVLAWLPDGSGVLLNRLDGGRPVIYRPGEGFFALPPLLADAEWLVGVIDCC